MNIKNHILVDTCLRQLLFHEVSAREYKMALLTREAGKKLSRDFEKSNKFVQVISSGKWVHLEELYVGLEKKNVLYVKHIT